MSGGDFLEWLRSFARSRPSRTSQAVALVRAEMKRPSSPEGDPGAQESLCRGMSATSASSFRPQIRARTRFFDDQVVGAISAGTSQVVVCGAGYDDRGLRFRTTGLRFFELDHPGTQVDKARRLRAIAGGRRGLTLAPADFRTDDVATVLDRCGHDAARASLFICEGLLVYLDQRTCSRLLAGLRSRAAPGSTLAVSLAVHREGVSSDAVTTAANARRPSGRREPWRTILPLDAHLALISRAGWRVERSIDAAQLEAEAVPGRTQLVTAVSGPGY
jgi:methyltransferase (TIGR00027 family)